jgi:hypothetical protein
MGANILQMGCQIQCIHGGVAVVTPSNVRVKVSGSFALLSTDIMTIIGCQNPSLTGGLPCVTIQWLNEAKRVKIQGTPVLLETSIGLCNNSAGAPQGIAIISGVQQRVKGI